MVVRGGTASSASGFGEHRRCLSTRTGAPSAGGRRRDADGWPGARPAHGVATDLGPRPSRGSPMGRSPRGGQRGCEGTARTSGPASTRRPWETVLRPVLQPGRDDGRDHGGRPTEIDVETCGDACDRSRMELRPLPEPRLPVTWASSRRERRGLQDLCASSAAQSNTTPWPGRSVAIAAPSSRTRGSAMNRSRPKLCASR